MALVDMVIPVGKSEPDEITIRLTAAGEVEIRQLGQVVTITKDRRVELLDVLVIASKAVDLMTRPRPTRTQEV